MNKSHTSRQWRKASDDLARTCDGIKIETVTELIRLGYQFGVECEACGHWRPLDLQRISTVCHGERWSSQVPVKCPNCERLGNIQVVPPGFEQCIGEDVEHLGGRVLK